MVPDSLAYTARIAHDAGLAAWVGGSMFGKFAMNPAVRRIDDRADRGRVVNTAWNAYNVVNGVAFAGIVGGWLGARATEARPDRLSGRERSLSLAKDALMATTLVISAATGVQGIRLARQAPDGAVPIESGTVPAPETPPAAATIQRSIGWLSSVDIALGLGLIGVNAALAQENHSRPPARRALLRRSR